MEPDHRVVEVKLDFGCGPNPREGFEGVDIRDFGQKWKLDLVERDSTTPLGLKAWPWDDASVDEAHSSHFVEHLEPNERTHFVNELWRILKPGGKCQVITPHWASQRAYGDLTHKWPPVSEFWWYYLNKEWRAANAPHNDLYTCDFTVTWGYSMRPDLLTRTPEYQARALTEQKEAAQDMLATLVKKVDK